MIFWLEDAFVEEDPGQIDCAGIITPVSTTSVELSALISVEFTGDPLELLCRLAVDPQQGQQHE